MSDPQRFILVPFDKREALTLAQAAEIADRSEATVRSWCALHDIGRRVAGGNWRVSRVALAMFLDGKAAALSAYLSGDRTGPGFAPISSGPD
jgi:hypothetical protein